jgi:hypothetical protein
MYMMSRINISTESDNGADTVPCSLVAIGIGIAIGVGFDIAVGLIVVISIRPFPNCITTPSEFCQHRNNPVKESCSYPKVIYIPLISIAIPIPIPKRLHP